MIDFKYTSNGIPVIVLGDLGKLSFSKLTACPERGYKYLVFSHNYDDIVSVKKAGERKFISIPTSDSYMINMYLEKNAKSGVGLPHKALPSRMKDFIKKNLKPFIEDGYIHYADLDLLEKKLKGKDVSKILGKVQKKRKKRKPKLK